MVYDVISRMFSNEELRGCVITVLENDEKGERIILGGSVTGLDRSSLRCLGGESGYEEFSIPLQSVLEIRKGSKTLFKRKPEVRRVFLK